MNRALLTLGLLLAVFAGARAQAPLPPLPTSPVATFRMLLATNEAGRNLWLAAHKPAQRQYLETKVAEFLALSPAEREARLQALELRWHLPQLIKMTPAERASRLAQIPEPERTLLDGKLKVWSILPPPIQQDMLANQLAISVYVSAKQGGTNENFLSGLSPERRKEMEEHIQRFEALPKPRREQAIANFEQFISLPTNEQSKTLRKLTAAELAQMQQSLTRLEKLSPGERQQALAGLKKFAELSPAERAAFLQNAGRWQAMSEMERQDWRKMVARLRAVNAIPPLPPARKATAALVGQAGK